MMSWQSLGERSDVAAAQQHHDFTTANEVEIEFNVVIQGAI
jgi:hypothetical protein